MLKVSDIVYELVKKTPFIAEALKEGLVNTSALARLYQDEVEAKLGRKVKQGSIIMAINRMNMGSLDYERKRLIAFFSKLRDMLVRTSLVDYTYKYSGSVAVSLRDLLSMVSQKQDVFCTYCQGVAECTIIVTESIAEELEKIFKNETLINKETNLAALTLLLPAENRVLSGIYYFILKELAWQDINVVEVISTSNEFTIVVNQKDLDRTFAAINNLKGGKV
ncbi:MAG TPA: hypothetical protein PKD18_07460 [Saprospiraceae bacterium]|nr:hypothetical protein [Saprospiraceae bacterium]HOY13248.1 hypothetical protein [Saprospiraceae bacterium]HPN71825.1 hypothetical protein [Saprospiraceae bacterium]